ncbi:SpoIIAA family protein [Crocinitomix algicola]|uniref:STAS/SEC14 domain-containing protein n=1 Tax=Crocinitomix algicola TaxID=1740263 RepID=UPI00082F966D|nr:STAS/SEC14 domain-containing protein [Crocinitomix algicola]
MEDFSFESKHYKFKYEDGILFGTYLDGPITLELAKEIVDKRLELMKGEETLILVDVIGTKGVDRDARSFLSSKKGSEGLKAGAIVTDSAFTRHLANFFLKIPFNQGPMPGRLFSNYEDAIKWLRQFE